MSKLKYSSLIFVSSNEFKYQEYVKLIGISDLNFSKTSIVEPQGMNIQLLVEAKIKDIIPLFPRNPFFVEHTGLFIDAWKGLPGGLIDLFMRTVGNEGICKMMTAYKEFERVVRARVVIGYYHQDSGILTFQGETVGTVSLTPRGTNNFGWDPIFIPEGSTKTYAEMTLEEKFQTSMKTKAIEGFVNYLENHFEL